MALAARASTGPPDRSTRGLSLSARLSWRHRRRARFVLRDEALVVAGCTTSQGPAVRRPEPDSLDGTSRSETCSISASSIILLGPSSPLQTAESFHHERWGGPPTVV